MSIFEEWPYNWFGLWKKTKDDPFNVPVFDDVVDIDWNPPDLNDILRHLETSPVTITSSVNPVKCSLCEHLLTEPSTQRSDGVWVWHSTLSHYVKTHHVRLPDRMVEHIRSQRASHGSILT